MQPTMRQRISAALRSRMGGRPSGGENSTAAPSSDDPEPPHAPGTRRTPTDAAAIVNMLAWVRRFSMVASQQPPTRRFPFAAPEKRSKPVVPAEKWDHAMQTILGESECEHDVEELVLQYLAITGMRAAANSLREELQASDAIVEDEGKRKRSREHSLVGFNASEETAIQAVCHGDVSLAISFVGGESALEAPLLLRLRVCSSCWNWLLAIMKQPRFNSPNSKCLSCLRLNHPTMIRCAVWKSCM